MSILEELYNGNIYPAERHRERDRDYEKVKKQLVEYIDELLPLLNDEELKLWENIGDKISDLSYFSEKESFIGGFCLGAQVMREIMDRNAVNFPETK